MIPRERLQRTKQIANAVGVAATFVWANAVGAVGKAAGNVVGGAALAKLAVWVIDQTQQKTQQRADLGAERRAAGDLELGLRSTADRNAPQTAEFAIQTRYPNDGEEFKSVSAAVQKYNKDTMDLDLNRRELPHPNEVERWDGENHTGTMLLLPRGQGTPPDAVVYVGKNNYQIVSNRDLEKDFQLSPDQANQIGRSQDDVAQETESAKGKGLGR
jgi:hypothetical protein